MNSHCLCCQLKPELQRWSIWTRFQTRINPWISTSAAHTPNVSWGNKDALQETTIPPWQPKTENPGSVSWMKGVKLWRHQGVEEQLRLDHTVLITAEDKGMKNDNRLLLGPRNSIKGTETNDAMMFFIVLLCLEHVNFTYFFSSCGIFASFLTC